MPHSCEHDARIVTFRDTLVSQDYATPTTENHPHQDLMNFETFYCPERYNHDANFCLNVIETDAILSDNKNSSLLNIQKTLTTLPQNLLIIPSKSTLIHSPSEQKHDSALVSHHTAPPYTAERLVHYSVETHY